MAESCYCCQRAAKLSILVDQFESRLSQSKTEHGLLSHRKTGHVLSCLPCAGTGDALANAGRAVHDAISARKYARQIASAQKSNPVSAIAEAAWKGDPQLFVGDSLIAFAPHVAERYGKDGKVISLLTFANSNAVETSQGLVTEQP